MADSKMVDVEFPSSGVDRMAGFNTQRQNTTPQGVNVMGFEPTTDRNRGGTRPGLVRYIDDQLPHTFDTSGSRMIQELNVIVNGDTGALLVDDPGGDVIDDPSSPGGSNTWGHGTIAHDYNGNPITSQDQHTRNPGPRRVRRHGSGIRPNPNTIGPAPTTGRTVLFQGTASVHVTVHSVPVDFFGLDLSFTSCMCVSPLFVALAGAPTDARQFNGWHLKRFLFFAANNITQNGWTFNSGSNVITGTPPNGVRDCVSTDYPNGDLTANGCTFMDASGTQTGTNPDA